MKKIFSLTNVFIKEFYQNLSIFDKEKKEFNKKSMFFWLIMIIVTCITYLSYEIITFLVDCGQPQIFLNLYFLVLAILLLFQTILVCTNIFFFSKDIENVLHMPLKPVELLLAKFNTLLCMLYISEGIIGLIPLALYGLLTHSHFLFYLWGLLILVVFPILLAATISIIMLLFMRFAKFIKNKDVFQLIITIILITFLCILEYRAFMGLFSIKNDQQAAEQLNDFSQKAEQANKYFLIINPSVYILSNSLSIMSILSFIKIICYNIISLFIFITIGKITYLKDILNNIVSSTNKKRKKIKIEKNTKYNKKWKAYIKKELKMLIREPIFFMQCVFPVIMILFTFITLIIVLLPAINEILQDETIQDSLQNLSFNTEAVCDILIVLQVLFSISNISLTAISREGKNALFIKYIPIELYQQFLYKNIPQILLNLLVSIIVLGLILYVVPSINILYLFMVFIISILINLINSYLMLVVDLRRPNLDWDTEYSVVKKSDNKLFQYVLMIINILFLMYIAKIFSDVNIFISLIGEIIIFTIIFIIIDRCIKKWQNKLFNKII
jgi:ABC-2 type transport system permease protein